MQAKIASIGAQSIAIVDYGMGNVRSVQKAIEHVAPNDRVFLTDNADLINEADLSLIHISEPTRPY